MNQESATYAACIGNNITGVDWAVVELDGDFDAIQADEYHDYPDAAIRRVVSDWKKEFDIFEDDVRPPDVEYILRKNICTQLEKEGYTYES
jgi:hypothetical protein